MFPVHPPAMSRETFNYIRLLGVLFNLTWNTSRDGGSSTTPMCNLWQCFTTLIINYVFLGNHPLSSLSQFPSSPSQRDCQPSNHQVQA